MIKRICSILTAVVLTACLTACGDGEISEKEYQSFLSDMGISGVESAVEGAVYVEAFSNKIDTAYYQPDKIGGEQYRLIAQTCGEEKKTEMYGWQPRLPCGKRILRTYSLPVMRLSRKPKQAM